MKVTKNILAKHQIYNSWSIAEKAKSKLFIVYNFHELFIGDSWQIVGMGFDTDLKTAWYNWGRKTFNVFGRANKEKQRIEAINWVRENYDITEFERDPFGNYQIKGSIEKAIEAS